VQPVQQYNQSQQCKHQCNNYNSPQRQLQPNTTVQRCNNYRQYNGATSYQQCNQLQCCGTAGVQPVKPVQQVQRYSGAVTTKATIQYWHSGNNNKNNTTPWQLAVQQHSSTTSTGITQHSSTATWQRNSSAAQQRSNNAQHRADRSEQVEQIWHLGDSLHGHGFLDHSIPITAHR
jgi:hypothetical protein